MLNEAARKIFDDYYGFDDGLIKSFEYDFFHADALRIKIDVYARNYELEGDVWRTVRIIIDGVSEVRSVFEAGAFNVICSRVKLLNFDGKWCVEVDGDFGHIPISLEAIRSCSTCYVLGERVEVMEVDE